MALLQTNKLYLLPIIAFILMPVSFSLICAIAVASRSISPLFPLVSDGGVEGPGRFLFGPLATLTAMVITVLGVYAKQAHEISIHRYNRHLWTLRFAKAVNNVALVGAVVSASGIFIAGNIPQTASAVTHQVGALLAFAGGISFTFAITIYSIVLPLTAWLAALRVTLCLVITATFAGSWLTLNLANHPYVVAKLGVESVWIGRLRLSVDDDAIIRLTLTCVNEWILCICFGLLLLTLIPEFRPLRVSLPTIVTHSNMNHMNYRGKIERRV